MTSRAQQDSGSDGMPTFSPIFDQVSKNLGMSAASVYGVIWRHCQLRDGVCRASLHRMAALLGCNISTVQRQIRRLLVAGYIEDTTPALRNHPHSYRVTGMAGGSSSKADPAGQDDHA